MSLIFTLCFCDLTCFCCCVRFVKKVYGGILICDVLFVTAVIFIVVIDVFLGIEMIDVDIYRIKIVNRCRFCGKIVFSKKTFIGFEEKFKFDFERYGVNVEEDNDFIYSFNVC